MEKFEKPESMIITFDNANDVIVTSCDDHYCFECTNCYSQYTAN